MTGTKFKNLAKPNETIIDHTMYCFDVAKQLSIIFKEEINEILSSDHTCGDKIFFITVLFHDFGKYAQPFQNITLNSDSKQVWNYRHEIFSAEFVNLISNLNESEKELIQLAILSHHNKTITQLEKAVYNEKMSKTLLGLNHELIDLVQENRKNVYLEGKNSILEYHEKIFDEINEILKRSTLDLDIDYELTRLVNIFDLIEEYYRDLFNFEYYTENDKLIFLKGLLVTTDHLGSAHQSIKNIELNIEEVYKNKFNINGKGLRTIQKNSINSRGVSSILIAPTGSGKTEASFLWANENLKRNPNSRIFYILPYTASINGMFERISKTDFAINKVDILYGKSLSYYYDLVIKDRSEKEISENIDIINKEIRLLKLIARSYTSPIKIVTPHQIIKNFYGLKHFEEAFLQYLNGLFIFDEIHCYDKIFLAEMIVVMMKLKENFKGKLLIMSATFPTIIEDIFRTYLEIDSETIQYFPEELCNFTKIKLKLFEGNIEDSINIRLIQKDIDSGKRILIICNTITKAQLIYKKIKCNEKILIHSAFNTHDRKIIEKQIIDSEESEKQIQVLVGTQAIEVSLDLDYDCCYSEIASIDALIQRFGRVYRRREINNNILGIVNVFKNPDKATSLIYNENISGKQYDIINKTLEELQYLNEKPLEYSSLCSSVNQVYGEDYKKSLIEVVEQKISNSNQDLIPMKDYTDEAKIYFDQFDGIKVLPSSLRDLYTGYITEKRYIDADNLLVKLSERKLFNYYRKNYVKETNIIGKNVFVADENILGYDNKIGLYLKEELQNDSKTSSTNFELISI
jgi:CRISPR-associated endonuclease/helicase Cas3